MIEMTQQLRTLVTGVASGIGASVADALRSRGDRVFGVDFQGGDWLQADLSVPAERERVIAATLAELGGIDVLVNVAGIYRSTPFGSSDVEDWRKVWAINLEAPLSLMSLAFESMRAQQFGRVVNITSVHANFSRQDALAYDVGKAGLEAATRSFALTGAEHGILANAVAPGFVRTQMSLNDQGVDEADTEEFRSQYVETGRLPLRRASMPNEIAEAVLWLSGRSNTYTTGQTLTVDGGLTATF
jgi:NAD(P)-dependent dehydrogenase (short-subunit alcohol dehydrogenase family)